MIGTIILVLLIFTMAIAGGVYIAIQKANENDLEEKLALALKNQVTLQNTVNKLVQAQQQQQKDTQALSQGVRKLVKKMKQPTQPKKMKAEKEASRYSSAHLMPKQDNKKQEQFMKDCVLAMTSLGMTKREAKLVAQTTINRSNPKTIEEFIKEALISPS